MTKLFASSTYDVARPNKLFDANTSLVEYEVPKIIGVTFLAEVDLSEVERVRAAAVDTRPTYTAFVAKAVALALREHSYMNGRVYRRPWLPFFRPRVQRFKHCDITVAAERIQPGMEAVAFADILRGADQLSLVEVARWLRQLSLSDVKTNKQWREFSRTITRLPRWLSHRLIRMPCFLPSMWVKYRGGAVLISSPAKYGVDSVIGTWAWPLGISFGLVKRRPVVKGEEIVACPTFTLTLTFDRRLVAGAQAAQFFKRTVDLLEHAETQIADSSLKADHSEPDSQP